MEISQELKSRIPYDPPIPLLGNFPQELKILHFSNTFVLIFIAAVFIIAISWRQSIYPSTDNQIKKMWHLYIKEYY